MSNLQQKFDVPRIGRLKHPVDLLGSFTCDSYQQGGGDQFRGWAVVDLDQVLDNARTPKASAVIANQDLQKVGHAISATPEASSLQRLVQSRQLLARGSTS